MDYIPHSITSNPNFATLMQFFHHMESYSRQLNHQSDHHYIHRGYHGSGAFVPNFDVRELKDGFELYGELPGVKKIDIAVEFPEPQILVIRGFIGRPYACPPHMGEDDPDTKPDPIIISVAGVTPSGLADDTEVAHAPTVSAKSMGTPFGRDKVKCLASERRVGEFYRSFTLPERVHQDGTTATLDGGVLIVRVPKVTGGKSNRCVVEVV